MSTPSNKPVNEDEVDNTLPAEPVEVDEDGKPVSPGKSDEDHGKNASAPGQDKKDESDAQPKRF